MTDAKICPMQNTTCIKEECAWWIQIYKYCAIFEIAMDLDEIANKMSVKHDN